MIVRRFLNRGAQSQPGESYAIVGGGKELGEWGAESVVSMEWTEGDVWKGTVEVPADSPPPEFKVRHAIERANDAMSLFAFCMRREIYLMPHRRGVSKKRVAKFSCTCRAVCQSLRRWQCSMGGREEPEIGGWIPPPCPSRISPHLWCSIVLPQTQSNPAWILFLFHVVVLDAAMSLKVGKTDGNQPLRCRCRPMPRRSGCAAHGNRARWMSRCNPPPSPPPPSFSFILTFSWRSFRPITCFP